MDNVKLIWIFNRNSIIDKILDKKKVDVIYGLSIPWWFHELCHGSDVTKCERCRTEKMIKICKGCPRTTLEWFVAISDLLHRIFEGVNISHFVLIFHLGKVSHFCSFWLALPWKPFPDRDLSTQSMFFLIMGNISQVKKHTDINRLLLHPYLHLQGIHHLWV